MKIPTLLELTVYLENVKQPRQDHTSQGAREHIWGQTLTTVDHYKFPM